jgi:anti-sigma B factor antagonist
MSCEINCVEDHLHVIGEMTIYHASLLSQALVHAVRDQSGTVCIDLSEVSEIDTAGLQLLLLTRRASMACGGLFSLLNPSNAVCEVLTLCGLGELIPASSSEARS